ncbi:MAG TPA: hypothetical protein VN851_25415 [Thermoanaerobaculia bacterium]|nr:hypothetical protein [Thermoanaerobaculia bacterium]
MFSISIPRSITPFAIALLAGLSMGKTAHASDWQWSVTPYAWATDVNTDVSINDRQLGEREVEFSDLVDDLDFTAQLHVEGQRGKNGVLFDVFNVQLADDEKRIALPAPLSGEALADGDVKLTILDLGGIFNPRGDGEGFSLLYGGRMIDRDLEVGARFDLAPGMTLTRRYEVSETLYDAMLGARYAGRITPRWTYALQADASTGGTKQTWSGLAGVGYSFGNSGRYSFLAGYRYMDVEFEKDTALGNVDADVTLSGFITGLKVAF